MPIGIAAPAYGVRARRRPSQACRDREAHAVKSTPVVVEINRLWEEDV